MYRLKKICPRIVCFVVDWNAAQPAYSVIVLYCSFEYYFTFDSEEGLL